ncbi:MAG: glycosyltransferase family 2 protein, partial [Promethearchaeota archaeon]
NGEYICLLNNDTEVLPDFIEKMVDFLEKHPNAGMISPKIKLFPEKQYIWNAGNQINFRNASVGINRGYLEFDPDDQKYTEIESNDFAAGTALFVRKKYLEKIGLIDEIYFMYWEDPDWNFRAKALGYESYYVPTTIVYHKIPINDNMSFRRQIFNDYFFKRNKQIIVWKFASLKELIIFYLNFTQGTFFEIIKKLWHLAFPYLIINLKSLWHGFRIGLKRRTHRSCKKYLIKDYFYIQKLHPF